MTLEEIENYAPENGNVDRVIIDIVYIMMLVKGKLDFHKVCLTISDKDFKNICNDKKVGYVSISEIPIDEIDKYSDELQNAIHISQTGINKNLMEKVKKYILIESYLRNGARMRYKSIENKNKEFLFFRKIDINESEKLLAGYKYILNKKLVNHSIYNSFKAYLGKILLNTYTTISPKTLAELSEKGCEIYLSINENLYNYIKDYEYTDFLFETKMVSEI